MTDAANPDDCSPLTGAHLRGSLKALGIQSDQKVAIAVSGGADSMCLAFLAKDIQPVVALVVDHRLRPNSTSEAQKVREILQEMGVESILLTWEHKAPPDANIQMRARETRYELMRDWCVDQDVSIVLTAHHRDDQAETLLLRLARGSGVYGMAGMARTRNLGRGVTLMRPLLELPKCRLTATLEKAGIKWIEDPSNQNEDFDRVKARNLLREPPLSGLTPARLAATAGRLRRSRDALEHYEQRWLDQMVDFFDAGHAIFSASSLEAEPQEITLRGLASIVRFAGGGGYIPRFEKLERLWLALCKPDFRATTLGGAQFVPLPDGRILVYRELAAIAPKHSVNAGLVWDGRFVVESVPQGSLDAIEIGALGDEGVKVVKDQMEVELDVPRGVAATLPAFYRAESLIAVPHLEYYASDENLPVLAHRWLASSKSGKKSYNAVQ